MGAEVKVNSQMLGESVCDVVFRPIPTKGHVRKETLTLTSSTSPFPPSPCAHVPTDADIRPFVCDCGKGFSRSDVLSRHKRQCRVVLQIDGGEEEAPEAQAPEDKPKPQKARRSSAAKPGRPKGSTKAAKAAAAAATTEILHADGEEDSGDGSNSLGHQHQQQQPPLPPPSSSGAAVPEVDAASVLDPAIAADSHAQTSASSSGPSSIAYSYGQGVDPTQADFPMTRPPPPHTAAAYLQGLSHAPVHSQISAISHQYYPPSSPESNSSIASRSEHGSPRYTSQGLVRHPSNPGSRFGLRNSSFDQYGLRQPTSAVAFSSTDAGLWEGLDTAKLPSPGHAAAAAASGQGSRGGASLFSGLGPGFPVTSPMGHLADRRNNLSSDASYFRIGNTAMSGGGIGAGVGMTGYSPGVMSSNGSNFNFVGDVAGNGSYPPITNSQGQEPSGTITPKEPVRFSVATLGPLSPFSNTALSSSMSPYLSAFSNARDTPLVSSPRSGLLPGTPGAGAGAGAGVAGVAGSGSGAGSGAGLASLDPHSPWSHMRPPSRPVSRHNSVQAGITTGSAHTSPDGKNGSSRQSGGKPYDPSVRSTSGSSAGSSAGSSSSAEKQSSPIAVGATSVEAPPASSSTSSSSSAVAHANDESAAAVATTSSKMRGGTQRTSQSEKATEGNSQQYFENGALTPGPEAFLLRVQGGTQELSAGIITGGGGGGGGGTFASSSPSSTWLTVQSSGATRSSTPLWDPSLFASGSVSVAASSQGLNKDNSLGWLMSPSIQQLLNVFSAAGGQQERADYFEEVTPADASRVDVGAEASPADALRLSSSSLHKALSDAQNPFFIPPHLFRACYAITHWSLPPLTRLSMLALHAQQNLLKHFPIIHEPCFRLDLTPACLAFAICMLGCHEVGRKWWAGEEVIPRNSPFASKSPYEPNDVYVRPTMGDDNEPSRLIDEEDGQELVKPIVMTEKMDMLLRSFASNCKTQKDKSSVIQALMLFQCNNFLSSDPTTRTIAAISHGSVVALARQAGLFDPESEHAKREISFTPQDVIQATLREAGDLCHSKSYLPVFIRDCSDEEKVWRRWAELEGRRRTAFIIFTMDTVASLDAGIPTLLTPEELCHLPLPSPDMIWRAATVKTWRANLDSYAGPSLDDALHQLLSDDASNYGISIYGAHGPFARLVMVVALLRGIISLLEGRSHRVPRPSPLQAWIQVEGADGPDTVVSVFKRALSRWRAGWDQDRTCRCASGPKAQNNNNNNSSSPEGAATRSSVSSQSEGLGGDPLFTSFTASGATPVCDDALPLYWLAHVLIGHAGSDQRLPMKGSNASSPDSATSGSSPSRDMPDFRAMLRFAKDFVLRGEK
ncbi:hypothetical protein IE53DRAFT_258996 [Violaceomyces palustris]|uniref:Uncharacterized protein n=1 Tax=Violaceomyces palustris TaxID=1673888 RepID=A0ACD0P3N1_9BASI|nr:hypothetical protein IE53DRAFT_258996 [Violaceomyces palustris]